MAPLQPLELASALNALTVSVERIECTVGSVAIPSYPGGKRPSGQITLHGLSTQGRGEIVAWDHATQQEIAVDVQKHVTPKAGFVRDFAWPALDPYGRAAAQAALIDLALRQNGLSFADLTEVSTAKLRYVVSFDACPFPYRRATDLRRRWGEVEFKIDVDPDWSPQAAEKLASLPGIVTLDFKARGNEAQQTHLRQLFPSSWFEDPPIATHVGRLAWDKTIKSSNDIDAITNPEHAINLKAPRMGGFFEVLTALHQCRREKRPFYFGGMFEVGPGRRQARKIAALFAPESANDLAPLPVDSISKPSPSPLAVDLSKIGF